jgi:hypothetical protein
MPTCTWPDGGCGEPVVFIVSPTTGKKMCIDPATAQKRVVLLMSGSPMSLAKAHPDNLYAVMADTYLDHHATCATWLARLERERAAKAGRGS